MFGLKKSKFHWGFSCPTILENEIGDIMTDLNNTKVPGIDGITASLEPA